MAIGLGEPKEKVRAMMIEVKAFPVNSSLTCTDEKQKMIQPVGKPPEVQD